MKIFYNEEALKSAAKNISIARLSKLSGISRRTIRRLLNGESYSANKSTLQKICKVLNLNTNSIKRNYSRKKIEEIFNNDNLMF